RLVRSFHYAAYDGLYGHADRGSIPKENLHKFEPWVRYWNLWVSLAFLKAYCPLLVQAGLLPEQESDLREMLLAYLLNEVLAELGQELPQVSDRLKVPLRGILYLLGDPV